MKHIRWHFLVLLVLIVCVREFCAKGGRGGGGRGGGGRGGGGWSWGGSGSRSSSSSSRATQSATSASKGNWFSNLFSSKSTSSNTAPASSSSNPKQPAHNPSYTGSHTTFNNGRPPSYSSHGYHDQPPSYSSLGFHNQPPSYSSLYPNRANTWSSPSSQIRSTNTYHFIPIPSYGYSHYHHGPSYYHGSRPQSTERPEIYSTPAPIVDPIVAESSEASVTKAPLVVVCNNMVLYGDYKENTHQVIVIDEQYEDPGEIPAHFLQMHETDGPTDYFPRKKEIQITIQYNNETTSLPTHFDNPTPTIGTSTQADTSTKLSSKTNESYALAHPEQAFDMQFFSDVDGAI